MQIGYEAKRVFHNKTGLGNYSRDVINVLSASFPANEYFLFNPKKSSSQLFVANNENVFEKLPNRKIHKKLPNYWRQKGIVIDLELNNIEVFHGLSGEIPAGLSRKGIKSVVTIHDLIFLRYPKLYSFIDRYIYTIKFKRAVKQADIVIAISEQTKLDIIKYFGISAKKVKVIYQGCNKAFKKIYSEDYKADVVAKYNLPEKYVLNVGTLEQRKNALSIVKAIKNIDIRLVLIGKKTAYTQNITDYISENQLTDKVVFLENVEVAELAIIYQLSTAFVYPSIFEGFGIPIIEALFSRAPVITNKFGVFPEAGGPDSLYIDPLNSDEIAQKVKWIIQNPTEAEKISEQGFQYAQKFNDSNIADQLMDVYKSLVNG